MTSNNRHDIKRSLTHDEGASLIEEAQGKPDQRSEGAVHVEEGGERGESWVSERVAESDAAFCQARGRGTDHRSQTRDH